MTLELFALLFAAGLAGGIANAIAGGATLVTFPALLAAGLPPVVANASNAVAVTPGHLFAALADRENWPALDRATLALYALAVGFGIAGAALLLAGPERLFAALVPVLLGGATLVFAFSGAVRGRVVRVFPPRRAGFDAHACGYLLAPTALYGGYFGAGWGVLLMAILAASGEADLRRANALKNILATLVSFVTIPFFWIAGQIAWAPTLAVLAGAVLGGFAGGRLVRILPAAWVRRTVIAIGAAMTAIYAWRFWF